MTKSEHPQGTGVNYGQQPQQQQQQPNPGQAAVPTPVDGAAYVIDPQQIAQNPQLGQGQQFPPMEYAKPAAGQIPAQQQGHVPPTHAAVPPTQEYQGAPLGNPVAGQPVDDYQYPQGQSVLPEVPPFAAPPVMAPAPEQAPAAQAPATAPAPGMPQSVNGDGYSDPAGINSAGEQISQRLAQLQSQYDDELSSENWDQQQHNPVPNAAPPVEQYVAQQPAVDEFAAYPPQQPQEIQQQVAQQQPPQPQAYQEQPPSYQEPAQQGYSQPPMAVPADAYGGYGEESETGHQHYGLDNQMHSDGSSIAQESQGGGGLKKIMLGGAFVAALAVGGGAAYTYNLTDMFGSAGNSGAAPTIKAGSSPVKIIKQKIAGAKDSINKAMHNRLSGGSSNASKSGSDSETMLQKTMNDPGTGANAIASGSGMLPGSGTQKSGPRRVKTLIVRPDGTILRPAGGDTPVAKTLTATSAPMASGVDVSKIAKAQDNAKSGSNKIRRMKTIGEASVARRLDENGPKTVRKLAKKPNTSQLVKKVTIPASKPVRSASLAPRSAGAIGSPFVVQVTSRKSQTDALAAFADMQQKYPSLLGSYAPDIQRADLGNNGVWYRLRVGPVGSKLAAGDLCSSLKQAGHPGCFVRKK